MLGTDEILEALLARKIRKQEIAETLGLTPPRVTDLFAGKRKLSHDEAHRLVEHYGLEEQSGAINPMSEPVARLLARHAALTLDVELQDKDPRLEALAQDFVIFSRYAADPRVRDRVEAAEGFFLALSGMRSHPEELRAANER